MKKIIYLFLILLTACASPARQSLATPTADYPDNLNISMSGTASNPLVYDGQGQTVTCVSITGNHVVLRNFIVDGCSSHGIYVNSKNVVIENNIVRNAESDRLNVDKTGCSGSDNWGSGIKVHVGGQNIIIRGNTVYENCGEGIAVTRGINVLVENNIVYDNFSMNIYPDNSNFVTVRNNQVYCTGIFLRDGRRPSGIVVAEEDYGTAWGAQRHDNQIVNNTVKDCFQGIASANSELDNGKEIRLLIDGNNVTNCVGSINCIKLDETNLDVTVSNNCITNSDQRIYVRYSAGVTLFNNICGAIQTLTPTLQVPTITQTVTRTPTPSRTPTRTPTKTVTPTLTSTLTSTPTLIVPTVTRTPTAVNHIFINGTAIPCLRPCEIIIP